MSGFDIIEPVSELDGDLKRYIRQQMTELQIPGVAVGMAYGDAIAVGGFGVTSIENPLSVTGDTVFQLGSITKTMTATAVMQLVDEGSVDLDRPVQDYLPDFRVADPDISKAVTVRHLMTNTGGWRETSSRRPGGGDDALSILVDRQAKLKQVTPFGTRWSYSNAAFDVLGRILEVHYGKPYEDLMQEQIWAPLGVRDACYFAHDVVLKKVLRRPRHRVIRPAGRQAVGDGTLLVARGDDDDERQGPAAVRAVPPRDPGAEQAGTEGRDERADAPPGHARRGERRPAGSPAAWA